MKACLQKEGRRRRYIMRRATFNGSQKHSGHDAHSVAKRLGNRRFSHPSQSTLALNRGTHVRINVKRKRSAFMRLRPNSAINTFPTNVPALCNPKYCVPLAH